MFAGTLLISSYYDDANNASNESEEVQFESYNFRITLSDDPPDGTCTDGGSNDSPRGNCSPTPGICVDGYCITP